MSTYEASAGSDYGTRDCIYKLTEGGTLELVSDTGNDNLGGNDLASGLIGMTPAEARTFVTAQNAEVDEINADRSPDNSHGYYWNMTFREM
jgi:hypothetical protein